MEDLRKRGYSQEEEYFARMNRELIEKRRKQLDAEKSRQPDRSKQPWWMTCPKCGGKMEEISMSGIQVDRCGGCKGVYFDAGELETLIQAQEPKGFLSSLRGSIF